MTIVRNFTLTTFPNRQKNTLYARRIGRATLLKSQAPTCPPNIGRATAFHQMSRHSAANRATPFERHMISRWRVASECIEWSSCRAVVKTDLLLDCRCNDWSLVAIPGPSSPPVRRHTEYPKGRPEAGCTQVVNHMG